MAWEQLQINKPHLAYTILGGFTSVFMLCSLFIKEKLYIGEATIATICGIIFGPIGAGLFVPAEWGNVDQITLECARIVLVVQCFAVGVELPKKYMTRHWKSVLFLLIPVMTYGWLVTSLFIWWMIPSLSWLESLCCAACVTATDPVLASSVVGKGRFAKRIPKHLRDLLSAESGCNDGMAFPFIYLSLYLIKYRPNATEVFEHWFCITVLYECVFGAIYGVCVGYAGRHAIKFAERKNLIDRESFLVFYFVLALWCAGTGSMLGLDDLLVGFCAGVAFSNDGWFSQQTEESHVSNVIDLLLNLAFFVFFGAIIPWGSYNRPDWGITPWRLVVIAIFVVLFRRIPIMVALKPVIPDIKTWREALFAGHFGPIGVGAVFVAILARAELESGDTTPLADIPEAGSTNYILIQLIWPITTFLILTSIIVHGSSIAVFTLGKHINTMRITMSYTTANEDSNWVSRLPRLTPKASMSMRKPDDDSVDEKSMFPPGSLPPVGGIPGGFLSRLPAADDDSQYHPSRPASIRTRRRKNWDAGHGPGGPISDSAISPRRIRSPLESQPSTNQQQSDEPSRPLEMYREGSHVITENQQGDVLSTAKPDEENIGPLDSPANNSSSSNTAHTATDEAAALAAVRAEATQEFRPLRRRETATAYRFDDNIVVENDEGEIIRRYKLPADAARRTPAPWMGWANKIPFLGKKPVVAGPSDDAADDNSDAKTVYSMSDAAPGKSTNWRMHDDKGRRLSKQQFLTQLQRMDPHARALMSGASMDISNEDLAARLRAQTGAKDNTGLPNMPQPQAQQSQQPTRMQPPPKAPVKEEPSAATGETAAERRRREAALGLGDSESDSDEEVGGKGRLEKGSTRQRRGPGGIRFADATPPSATPVSEEGGIVWGHDVKGKKKE